MFIIVVHNMLEIERETHSLIDRLDRVETKVGAIEDKVNALLEQGEVTQEHVTSLTDSLHEQRDHFQFMRSTLLTELTKYRRIFIGGSTLLVLVLLWILHRL